MKKGKEKVLLSIIHLFCNINMKIFVQHGSVRRLAPAKGSGVITTINMCCALSLFAEVYYSGYKFAPNESHYGTKFHRSTFELKSMERDYDLYIIRNNMPLLRFLRKKRPNANIIWFVDSFLKKAFKKSTILATTTMSWADVLRNGKKAVKINPKGSKYKRVITLQQSFLPSFKPLQDHAETQKIREEIGGDFIIGYFSKSLGGFNYPYILLKSIPEIMKKIPNAKIIIGTRDTRKKREKLEKKTGVKVCKVSHKKMPYMLSACDLVMITYYKSGWDYYGSLRTLETAACGVPLILPKSIARKEVLGDDYNLFVDRSIFEPPITKNKVKQFVKIIKKLSDDESLRNQISSQLIQKASMYTIEKTAESIKTQLSAYCRKLK